MPKKPLGEKRVCSNPKCRKAFSALLNTNMRVGGLCPECQGHVDGMRGWALDLDLYLECQKIAASEPRFYSGVKAAAYERDRQRELAAALVALNPLVAESLLDGGYTRQRQTSGANGWPSHLTGKKGGPRGSSD